MVIAVLFYRSAWAFVLYPIVIVVVYKKMKSHKTNRRLLVVKEQFMSGMQVLNTSLQAGLSMENAWKEVEKELLLLYGEKAYFYQEVKEINHQIALNISIEKLLLNFAYRTQIEDIVSFAEVFDYGKRTGGSWKKIINATLFRMLEKQDALKEIEVVVAGKKMEQQVMNVIPLGIIAFLLVFSQDYMSVLYHNSFGVLCMTVCLIGYIFALLLSDRILQIKV